MPVEMWKRFDWGPLLNPKFQLFPVLKPYSIPPFLLFCLGYINYRPKEGKTLIYFIEMGGPPLASKRVSSSGFARHVILRRPSFLIKKLSQALMKWT